MRTTLSLLLICCSTLLFAQTEPKAVTIDDITKAMSRGEQPGFRTEAYQNNKKTAAEALSKYLKEQGKVKTALVNNEYVTVAGIVKSISAKPLNIYFILNEYETHVEVLAFYEMDSAFLTKEKNETAYLSARKFTRDFAVFAYKIAAQQEVDAEEKKLKALQSELDKLYKEQDNLQKKINSEKQNIDNTKEKVSVSELDQERVRKLAQAQKETLSKAKAGGNEVVIKEEEKKLKALESEIAKMQKQEDGFHKNISDSEAAIREQERSIDTNKSNAALKQADIEKQRAAVNALTKKKDAIQ